MTITNEKDTSGEVSIDIVEQKNEIVKNEADIDGFIELRQKFIAKVNAICVEGKDYHIIQGKKSLAKGGAEKIASIFHWNARFERDIDSLEMLGSAKGLVAYKCTLTNGQFVGEGRGAAHLAKYKDENKTLKMAQKSAFIDAVLRASGLSDFFTQDLEDMPTTEIPEKPQTTQQYMPPDKQPTEKQKQFIKTLCKQKGVSEAGLRELAITYKGNPSGLIEFLLKYQKPKEDLPADPPMSEEDKKLADSIPF